MTDTVSSAVVKIQTSASMTTSPDIGDTVYQFSDSDVLNFSHGTGNNQVNQVWADIRTISASSSENLDLYGSLVSALNTTLNFAKIKLIEIKADSANINNVLVGGSAAGVAGMFVLTGDSTIDEVQMVIPPGGIYLIAAPLAGFTVTNTTGDILKIANSSSGTSVTYTIKVYGVV